MTLFTYISTRQSGFVILHGFYFHETSQFPENKPLVKISEFTVYEIYKRLSILAVYL